MNKNVYSLERSNKSNGFNYFFEGTVEPGAIILKIPVVTSDKRGINAIGWQTDGDITMYGTLSNKPEETILWQEIKQYDEVNKTISAIKVVNDSGVPCRVIVRVIMS